MKYTGRIHLNVMQAGMRRAKPGRHLETAGKRDHVVARRGLPLREAAEATAYPRALACGSWDQEPAAAAALTAVFSYLRCMFL
jgi:hypothetical protein